MRSQAKKLQGLQVQRAVARLKYCQGRSDGNVANKACPLDHLIDPDMLGDALMTIAAAKGSAGPCSQANESRLTLQRAQYLQQVCRIPSGALSAALDGSFVGDLAHQIEGEVADHGHVFGTVAGAQA